MLVLATVLCPLLLMALLLVMERVERSLQTGDVVAEAERLLEDAPRERVSRGVDRRRPAGRHRGR